MIVSKLDQKTIFKGAKSLNFFQVVIYYHVDLIEVKSPK